MSAPSLLPLGPYSSFSFSSLTLLLNPAAKSAPDHFQLHNGEWNNKSVVELLQGLLVPEQVLPVEQFFRKGINELLRRNKEPLTVNIECTLSSSRQSRKRVLLQLALPVSGADSIQGICIDISHIVKDGTPKYTLLDHHQVVDHQVTAKEQLLKNSPLRLTNLQYNVLKHRAKGMRAKEIAQQLSISSLAVYSVIRNLKDKTKMETTTLIEDLKEKGLLSLTWLNLCAEQGLVLDLAAVTSLLHFV